MKKILSLLGNLFLSSTTTLGLVSCKVNNSSDCERNDIGNWHQICSKNQPFEKVNNKYYVTIWKTPKNNKWNISLFKFTNTKITNIDNNDNYIIQYSIKKGYNSGLMLVEAANHGNVLIKRWEDDTKKQEFFKSLYEWTVETTPTLPKIDENGNII